MGEIRPLTLTTSRSKGKGMAVGGELFRYYRSSLNSCPKIAYRRWRDAAFVSGSRGSYTVVFHIAGCVYVGRFRRAAARGDFGSKYFRWKAFTFGQPPNLPPGCIEISPLSVPGMISRLI